MNNEKKLAEKIRRGDRQAFRWFYERQKDKLFKFVMGRVGNKEDVEELVQDTWLSFLDSLPLFRFGSKLSTFLLAIARHEIADYWRKKYAKKALKLVPFMERVYTEKLYSVEIVSDELIEVVEKVYELISPMQARLLQMKYEEEMSVKEMADKLGISVKAVESRLFRARKAFQKSYIEVQKVQEVREV